MLDCVLAKFPVEECRPGDLFCFNDVYISAGAIGHSPDLCFVVPVFAAGRLAAFVGVFGHFWDIGGSTAGSSSPHSTEIFQEGLIIPPVRLARTGVWNQDAYDLIIRNTRFPEYLEGDTRAVISACRTGEKRLAAFFERYGVDRTLAAFDRLIEQDAERAKDLMRCHLPDGTYEFSDSVDGDGVTDQAYRVHLNVSKRGDEVVFDFTGTDDQAKGAINYYLHPAILTVVLLGRYLQSLDQSILLNDGLREAGEVRLRQGSLLWPRFPGAVAHRAVSRMVVNNCLLGVFDQATKGRAPAPSSNYGVIRVRSLLPDGTYVYLFDGLGVGQGARPEADGIDAIYLIGQKNNPVEFVEANYPFRIERFGIHADSGGPGAFRGGCGIQRDYRMILPETTVGTILSSIKFPPFGVNRGGSGRPGRVIVNPGGPDAREVPAYADDLRLKRGDLLRVLTSGGGGWGDPFRRDPTLVARDVRRGYVTRGGAERDYGVVVDDAGRVDERAT
ncbi:MAG TPA: hydantoinase B/oxoprolinase family protein, partial [Dehalococcoidia bacterium]|nr:hydantoinase B/oxoprolinase family protein [Dehalococcoidia bacterium]